MQLRNIQKVWESKDIDFKIMSIRNSLEKKVDRARFLANSTCESGAWLQTLPPPQLGTHLTNDEFRIALALRLGSPIAQPYTCNCGDKVDKFMVYLVQKQSEQTRDTHHPTKFYNEL